MIFVIIVQEKGGRVMFCTKCGKPVEPDKKFCPYCGQPIKKPDSIPPNEKPKEEKEIVHEEKPVISKNKNHTTTILIVIIVALAAVICLILAGRQFGFLSGSGTKYQDNESNQTEETTTEEATAEDTQSNENIASGDQEQTEEVDPAEARKGLHSYKVVIDDCTWSEAYNNCISMGGYLATIDSREEWDYIIQQLEQNNVDAYYFYLNGSRDGNGTYYYWQDENGQAYGDPLNSSSFWGYDLWLEGEPSYSDQGTTESKVALLYLKSQDRWVLNDIPDNELYMSEYLGGKVAYICEIE